MAGAWWMGAFGINCGTIGNCSKKTPTLDVAFHNVAHAIIGLVGMLAIVFIIVSGIQMIMSNGNPARFKQARESLIYSLFGVALAIAAEAIVFYVTGIF